MGIVYTEKHKREKKKRKKKITDEKTKLEEKEIVGGRIKKKERRKRERERERKRKRLYQTIQLWGKWEKKKLRSPNPIRI